MNTQRYFALLIGILVIGGFFQILTLQKVAQIGMLKAIGASNRVVGTAQIIQIIAVTVMGVALGAALSLALSLWLPAHGSDYLLARSRVDRCDLAASDRPYRRPGLGPLFAQSRTIDRFGSCAVR